MPPIPLIDLKAQQTALQPALGAAIQNILTTTRFIGGPEVETFEKDFANFCGVEEMVSCANGTDALELLLDAWEIGPDDEVIVPAMSWISTSEVVATRGAKPVFVDIDAASYCLDVNLAEAAVTSRTKAIIVVHLYGQPAEMDALIALCKAKNLLLLEDCAQAHGAKYRGRTVGSMGDGAAFSFFPSKSLGAYGDAGACTALNIHHRTSVRALKNHGMPGRRHHHKYHGRNSRMDALQAAVLNVKLPHLTEWIVAKNRHADRYRELLADLEPTHLVLPRMSAETYHGYHLFVIRTPRRDALAEHLREREIATTVHYPTALPLHACYADLGHRAEDFPVAVDLSRTALSLPMFAELTIAQIERVCAAIHEFFAA